MRRAVVLNAANTPLELVEDHPPPSPGDGLILDVTACGVCIGAESTMSTAAAHINRLGTAALVGLAGGSTPFGFGIAPLETRFVNSVWGSRGQLDELLDLARREPSLIPPVEVLDPVHAQTAHERLRSATSAAV